MSNEKPALVLLHGWGNGPSSLLPLAKSLEDHFQIVMLELPGYGEQPALDHWQLEPVAQMLLDEAPQKALWLGWSLGGMIATYIAHHYPGRVSGLITLASNPHFLATPEWPNGIPFPLFEQFLKGMTQPEKTLSRFLSLMVVGEEQNMLLILKELKSIAKDYPIDPHALLESLKLLGSMNVTAEFKSLRLPTLSIFGRQDSVVPAGVAQDLSVINPSVNVFTLPGSHVFFLSHPNETKACILDWLKQRTAEAEELL